MERIKDIIEVMDRHMETQEAIRDSTGELRDNLVLLVQRNRELTRQLKAARQTADRMTKAAIYFSETYARLPDDIKAEFDRAGETVEKDFNKITGGDYGKSKLQTN